MCTLQWIIIYMTVNAILALRIDNPYDFDYTEDDMSSIERENLLKIHNAINLTKINERDVIKFMFKFDNDEDRHRLIQNYKTMYGINLITELKDKLTGKFENIITALFTPIDLFLAQEIHDGIHGIGFGESALYDIVCPYFKNHFLLSSVKNVYKQQYGQNIVNDFEQYTSGNFRKLMITCIENYDIIDIQSVLNKINLESTINARTMDTNVPGGTNKINRLYGPKIIFKASFDFGFHVNNNNNLVDTIINRYPSNDFRSAVFLINQALKNPILYFANRLRASLHDDVDYRSLIRIVKINNPGMLRSITRIYRNVFQHDLKSAIDSNTSGGFRKTLNYIFFEMEV